MDRTCEQCGASLAGRVARARFCGSSCRWKAHAAKQRTAEVVPIRGKAPRKRKTEAPEPERTVESTTLGIRVALLEQYADRELATPAGQIVLKLANDVDHLLPGTPGYAAVVKELRAAILDLETRTVVRKINPLLELRKRRQEDRASNG